MFGPIFSTLFASLFFEHDAFFQFPVHLSGVIVGVRPGAYACADVKGKTLPDEFRTG